MGKGSNAKKGCFYILIIVCIFFSFCIYKCSQSSFFKRYSKIDLTDNYDENEIKIQKLISYFNSIIPPDIYVDIEINNTQTIRIFHVIKDNHDYGGWHIDINSPKADTILNLLNWNKENIRILKDKLDEVKCISINNSNPVHLGFQRSVMSKFYYVIFDYPIANNDSLMKIYNDKCIYIFYRDNVVLEYGSGATGSLCFPKRFLE